MVAPYQYIVPQQMGQNPLVGAIQGFQAGAGLVNAFRQQVQQREQMKRERAMRQELNTIADSGNINPQILSAVSIKYPELSAKIKPMFDRFDDTEKKRVMGIDRMVFSGLNSNRPDLVVTRLNEMAQGYENGGNMAEAEKLRARARFIEEDQDSEMMTTGLKLASTMGVKEFNDTFSTISFSYPICVT